MGFTILHLSDIHAGPGEFRDVDEKDPLPEADRRSMLDRLASYLRALPATPDYVAVTGDITNRGGREGMLQFRTWLIDRIDERVLPEPERIVIVPAATTSSGVCPRLEVGIIHDTSIF